MEGSAGRGPCSGPWTFRDQKPPFGGRERCDLGMQELDGHVAIVVGGTKNLGLEVARELVARGSAVALVSRTPGDAQRVAAILAKAPGAAQGFCADVRDQAAIEGVVQSVYSRYGNVSILVNCATARAYKSVADTDLADWESVISTNLTGTFVSCKAVLPYEVWHLRSRTPRSAQLAG